MNKKRAAMVAILLVAVVAVSFAVPVQRFGSQISTAVPRGYGMFADESQIPEEMLAYRQARIDALNAQGAQTYGYGPGMMAQNGYANQVYDFDDCPYLNAGRGPVTQSSYGRYSQMQTSAYGRGGRQTVSYSRGGMMGGRW